MFGALYRWRSRLRRSAARHREKPVRGESPPCFPAHERRDAVKGVARRVVIVSDPDPRVFEEAIFVVREDFMSGGGIGESELLREARRAAGDYVEATLGRPFRRPPSLLKPAAWAAAGAVSAAVLWLVLRFFGAV